MVLAGAANEVNSVYFQAAAVKTSRQAAGTENGIGCLISEIYFLLRSSKVKTSELICSLHNVCLIQCYYYYFIIIVIIIDNILFFYFLYRYFIVIIMIYSSVVIIIITVVLL